MNSLSSNNNFNIDRETITNNLYLIAMIGVIIKLFLTQSTTSDGSSGPASGSVWGYGLIMFSVLGLLVIQFSNYKSKGGEGLDKKAKMMADFKKIFNNSIFTIILVAIIGWLVALNIIYFKEINEGKVATEYSSYNKLSTILVFIQLWLLNKYTTLVSAENSEDNKSGKKKYISVYKALSALLSVGNIITIIILNIILKYFSTDGFIGHKLER